MHAINEAISRGRAFGVIGIYGMGKGRYAEELAKRYAKKASVYRFSFKDMPMPSDRDVYEVFAKTLGLKKIPDSDFALHYSLVDLVKRFPNRRFLLLFEEAQNLIRLPPSFFDALESLRYYQIPRVSIGLFGQPQLRTHDNPGLTRLLHESYYYMPLLARADYTNVLCEQSRRLHMDFSPWKRAIQSLSGGHYGTVKYICQLLQKHRFSGKRLTARRVMAWANEEPMFPYFIEIIWRSLMDDERLLLTEFFSSGSISPSKKDTHTYKELLKLGIFVTRHNDQCIVPMYRDTILRIARQGTGSVPSEPLMISEGVLKIYGNAAREAFTYQERRVLEKLAAGKGNIVSYEALGEAMWGVQSARYSLWGIAQLIRRIRVKLSYLGISPKVIRTAPRQGYLYLG